MLKDFKIQQTFFFHLLLDFSEQIKQAKRKPHQLPKVISDCGR